MRTLVVGKPEGNAATEWPMPQIKRVQDGNRAAVRAIRAIGPDSIMAVFDNGVLSLIERGALAAQVLVPPGLRTLQTTHSAAISRSGMLIVTASSDSDVNVITCLNCRPAH